VPTATSGSTRRAGTPPKPDLLNGTFLPA
jgi:hypothetical protein